MKAAGHGRFHVACCSPDRHRRRRGGAPPWFHQYDARGLGQHIAAAHAASRAAARLRSAPASNERWIPSGQNEGDEVDVAELSYAE